MEDAPDAPSAEEPTDPLDAPATQPEIEGMTALLEEPQHAEEPAEDAAAEDSEITIRVKTMDSHVFSFRVPRELPVEKFRLLVKVRSSPTFVIITRRLLLP